MIYRKGRKSEIMEKKDSIVASDSIDRLFSSVFLKKNLAGISIDDLFRNAGVKFPQENENLSQEDLVKLDNYICKRTDGKFETWADLFDAASKELKDSRPAFPHGSYNDVR